MTANPYQDIAKEFLDLWQKQVTSAMGDKQFIHAMLELLQNMQSKPNAKSTATASYPTNAPAAEHELLAELTFRLAMCEKRIAALEAKKPTKPTARKTTKTNSERSKKPRK